MNLDLVSALVAKDNKEEVAKLIPKTSSNNQLKS